MYTISKDNVIHFDAPNVGALEKEYLAKAIDSGFVSSVGPFVAEFERTFTQYLQAPQAVATQSGTAALHMALYELGIGPGDEVIVPALTFAATVNPVLYAGATPVIVDVDPKTWNIDPARIEEAITNKTKAVIPVHLYGNPCEMAQIIDIAKEYNLYVVEDATESLGATLDGKHTGTFGDFGCLSFNGNKVITTGGGGMIVGLNAERLEHIRYLANQAKDKDSTGFHSEMGFNFRMTNVEAALGMAQLDRLTQFLQKKRGFREIYEETLGPLKTVHFQRAYTGASESGWFTSIMMDGVANMDLLMQHLKERGIPTRRVFMPLGDMPYLQKYAKSCPHAHEIYQRGLCLPSSTLNAEKDIKEAALIIREALSA